MIEEMEIIAKEQENISEAEDLATDLFTVTTGVDFEDADVLGKKAHECELI